ncbi:MAG: YkgJ family cysteine cluster protein [Planctomycetota bacterium]
MTNKEIPDSNNDSLENHNETVTCTGCGVCCFHMGYPAFILPQAPLTAEEIDADPELKKLALHRGTKKILLEGNPGEDYWHTLPPDLKDELEKFVDNYDAPADGELDGPCFWLDMETRQCKHHEHRPRVCRDFEIGCSQCHDWRRTYQHRIIQISS